MIWVLIDEAGEVQAAQVHRSTGSIDHDLAALWIARRSRFHPALRDGSAVPAWLLLPVTTAPPPPGCSESAVPVSAGGWLVDSIVLDPPELGVQYRYRSAVAEATLDLFIYPAASWPDAEEQVRQLAGTLREQAARGEVAGLEVVEQRALTVQMEGRQQGSTLTFRGHTVELRVDQEGERLWSYFAVFPVSEHYLRFRVSGFSHAAVAEAAAVFIDQILSFMVVRPAHCPLASRTSATRPDPRGAPPRDSSALAPAAVRLLDSGIDAGVVAETLPDTVHGLTLVDSTVFDADGGVGYRYQDAAGHYADVFVYPVGEDRLAWPDSARLLTEVEAFVAALAHGPDRGWYDTYQVPVRGPLEVQTAHGAVAGQAVVFVFRTGDSAFVSFVHLFVIQNAYLKVRLTLPADQWRASTLPDFALELVKRLYADATVQLPR